MCRVKLDGIRLSLTVRIYERDGYEVLGVHATKVAERQGPIERRVRDGTPQVYNLETAFQQRGRVGGGKVAVNAGNGRRRRLISVHERGGLTLLWAIIYLPGSTATDG